MFETEFSLELNRAIAEGELTVYYQPQISMSDGRISGAEALVRWNHPLWGMLPPDTFIEKAEEDGLITALDLHVVEQVCVFINKRLTANQPICPISVNLSRYDFSDTQIITRIDDLREQYRIPVHLLAIEITETAIVEDKNKCCIAINAFKKEEYEIEIDDFGSGQTSLSMLSDVQYDVVKLDKSFANGLTKDQSKQIILDHVVDMFHALGKTVLLEGVETQDQVAIAKAAKCDILQGFYFFKPVPEGELRSILDKK